MYTKYMTNTTYHSVLRIVSMTLAIMLLFDSGILSPVTHTLSENTQIYLAQSIGMYAGVEPNDINTLTAQLTQKERELNERESALAQREISVSLEKPTVGTSYSTYILSVILFLILVLLVLNYVLDFLRSRQVVTSKQYEKVA